MTEKIIYQGVQYNVSSFLDEHPGGRDLLQHYLKQNIDITEIFKSMHTKEAQKKLLRLEVTGKTQRPKYQRIYCKIEQRVRKFYQPSYLIEIAITLLIISLFVSSIYITHHTSMIVVLSLSQIMAVWSCHSQLHFRNTIFARLSQAVGGLVLGISALWWKNKHYRHHAFTNHDQLDMDIGHDYPIYIFPFILIKWRYESLFNGIKHHIFFEMVYFTLHYIFICRNKIFIATLISTLIAGLFIAVVTQGNHEREHRFKVGKFNDFLIQQIESTRNYGWKSIVSTYILGGFNFHIQHHLFPQIPFYNLRKAHRIIKQELDLHKQKLYTGDILI